MTCSLCCNEPCFNPAKARNGSPDQLQNISLPFHLFLSSHLQKKGAKPSCSCRQMAARGSCKRTACLGHCKHLQCWWPCGQNHVIAVPRCCSPLQPRLLNLARSLCGSLWSCSCAMLSGRTDSSAKLPAVCPWDVRERRQLGDRVACVTS